MPKTSQDEAEVFGRGREASPIAAPKETLAQVRSSLVDVALSVVAVLGTPMVALLLYRSHRIGWLAANWLYLIFLVIFILAALLRNRLPLAVRVAVLAVGMYCGGVAALFTLGPTGQGALVLLTFVFLAALIAGYRWGLLALLLTIVAMVVASRVAPAGWPQAAPLDPFIQHPAAWVARIGVFVFLAGVFLALEQRFSLALIAAIKETRQREERLHSALDLLESEASERRRAERAARRMRFSLDHARTPILWLRGDSSIFYSNRAAANLVGCSVEEMLEKSAIELDVNLDSDRWQGLLAQMRTRGDFVIETEMLSMDGTLVPVQITASHGEFEGVELLFALLRDISARRRTESNQQQMQKDLQQGQKMEAVGRLAGGIAHDFNNLLQSITGCAEEILATTQWDVSAGNNAREILASTARAASLVRRLLAFSQQMPIAREVVDLSEAVEATAEILRRLIGENIELVLDLNRKPSPILVDRNELEQILLNLAINARDAMPDGGRLEIATEREAGGTMVLRVRDEGQGIAPEILEHIFEPFFTTKGAAGGSGLGLATVYGIVERCGGNISVNSEEGLGTQFWLRFPTALDSVPEHSLTSSEELFAGGSETVLLAEDDDRVRRVMVRALTSRGFKVVEARDGSEAMEILHRRGDSIDALVLDIVLPDRSGPDVYREAYQLMPGVATLFSSGYGIERLEESLLDRPEVGRIQKPFSGDELSRALRAVIDVAIESPGR